MAWEYDGGVIVVPYGLATCLRFDSGSLWPGNMTEALFWKTVAWEHDICLDCRILCPGNLTELWFWNPVDWEHVICLDCGILCPGSLTEPCFSKPVDWEYE